MHGGAAAMNQVIHGDATETPACAAKSRHRRFCAAAVRNRLLEKFETCRIVNVRKEPSFLAVAPGNDPALSDSDLMIGTKMPPASRLLQACVLKEHVIRCSHEHDLDSKSSEVTHN
jgi:hypothetical protein